MRNLMLVALVGVSIGAFTNTANALPPNTPIFGACLQRYMNAFMYGEPGVFGGTMNFLTALGRAEGYCINAGLKPPTPH